MKRKNQARGGGAQTRPKTRARTTRHGDQNLDDELVVCPISLQRMRDPVMLMKSGITYDREYLCRSLLNIPTKDPKSNVEYNVPLEYAPSYTVRSLLTQRHGDEAFEEFDDSDFKAAYDEAWDKVMLERVEVDEEDEVPFDTVRVLAERGHAIAQALVGMAYDDSISGNPYDGAVDKDFDTAKSWYRKAAGQDQVGAQYNLGCFYDKGKEGVEEPNHKLAVHWWKKAAENGHVSAQYYLGIAYDNGEGIKQDHKLAVKWWRGIAEEGHAGAQYYLGCAYDEGLGTEQSDTLAMEWWRKAAEQDDEDAQLKLAKSHAKLAGKWYQKAANQGNAEAGEALGAALSSLL